jgi:hypothetical protein
MATEYSSLLTQVNEQNSLGLCPKDRAAQISLVFPTLILLGPSGAGKRSFMNQLTKSSGLQSEQNDGLNDEKYVIRNHCWKMLSEWYLDDPTGHLKTIEEQDTSEDCVVKVVRQCSEDVLRQSLVKRNVLYLITFNIMDSLNDPENFSEKMRPFFEQVKNCKGMIILIGTHSDQLNYPEYEKLESGGRRPIPGSCKGESWMDQLRKIDPIVLNSMKEFESIQKMIVWNGSHCYFYLNCKDEMSRSVHYELSVYITSSFEVMSKI